MRRSLIFTLSAGVFASLATHAQAPSGVQLASGVRLVVANGNTCPTLHIILPGHADSDRTIEVLFPEHVTVRKQGETEAKHLYLFRPGLHGDRPDWRQVGQSQPRGGHPRGAERPGSGAFGPDRIGQDRAPAHLNEKAGVSNPGDTGARGVVAQGFAIVSQHWRGLERVELYEAQHIYEAASALRGGIEVLKAFFSCHHLSVSGEER